MTPTKKILNILDKVLIVGLTVGVLEDIILMVTTPSWHNAGDLGIITFAAISFWLNLEDQKIINALRAEVETLKQ